MPWIGATLLGALVPAAIVSIVITWHGPSAVMLPALLFAFVVTLGHTLILGLPVALLYHAKRWHQPELAVATGFLIGGVPIGVLSWIAGGPGDLLALVLFGGLGAAGAVAFWLTLRWAGALDDPSSE